MSFFDKIQQSIAHSAYDRPIARFVFIEQVIQKILAKEKSRLKGTYLDVGCYHCFASLVLSKSFSEIVNLDLDKSAIKLGKKNCESNNINAHFVIADAQVLPFQLSSFDVITSFSVIEHVGNQNIFLREVNRILGDGGIFIMQVPNRNFFVELHTGVPFPAFFTKKMWRLYCRYLLKITYEFKIKNLTKNEAIKICRPVFSRTHIFECNYTEENVPSNLRLPYRFLKKVGALHLFPLSWILFCTRGFVEEKQRN